jgi:acetyl-CoA C-acetyltransferase
MNDVVIVGAVRTPVGKFMGGLSSLSAVDLGVIVVNEALKRSNVKPEQVEDIVGGMVYRAGTKGNPARQVQIKCGIPVSVGAVTVEQQCASSMRAFEIAAQQIMLGKSDISVAFGTESMSNAPHLLLNSRKGYRLGDSKIEDSLLYDALIDAFIGQHMGITAENLAEKYKIKRKEQDELAVLSHKRAIEAQKSNKFGNEIVPVEIKKGKKNLIISFDECPREDITFESIQALKPAFKKDGTVTAANASSLNDGAAALVLMSLQKAESMGIKPLALLKASATVGVEPQVMGIGPVHVIPKALEYANLLQEEIDYFEINEAFAAQFLAVNRELNIPMNKINVNGSGISIGHPVGCTGIRIMVSLINELKRRNDKYGCASLCVGGGPAMAVIIENLI